ncbi:MAG: gluconokinase [Solirubrobacteraceae bacterium]|nr:gluconokinase [Solirubrobacteraceae bacterium]
MTAVVLGVDIGTTSTKVVAFAPDGGERAAAEAGYELLEPEPGAAVQDPEAVLAAVTSAVRDAAAAARADGCEVAGLAFSSAMHGLLGVDEAGAPLTPLITWADVRAADEAERLRREHFELHGATGTPLHPMSPLVKLCWLAGHEPSVFARAARWAGLKELLLARWAGDWVIDHSCASGTGMLDLRTLAWHPGALEVAGVRPEQLSRPVPVSELLSLGEAAAGELGLPEGLPLVIGGGDGPLANLGLGAVRPGVAACSIGTSGALRVVVEAPVTDPRGRVFCYALTPGRWVVGGAINNGGVVLEWAGDALAPDLGEHAEQELLALAEQAPPGSDALLMLPYLLSERAPHWSALPRGAYVGLTRAHRREHLVRAALEGVCQQLAVVLTSVRDAGHEVTELRATGGFARSGFWRQLLADVLGMEIGFPAGRESSAFGAALVGMEALGIGGSIERAAELVTISERLEPDPSAAATYARQRETFAALYDALVPAFTALRSQA